MSSKELIDKIAIKSLSPLKLTDAERREIIAALEAADRDVLHWKMKHDRKCEEIAALKAQQLAQWEALPMEWKMHIDASRAIVAAQPVVVPVPLMIDAYMDASQEQERLLAAGEKK